MYYCCLSKMHIKKYHVINHVTIPCDEGDCALRSDLLKLVGF
jgi:hypothetical protein